MIRKTIETTFCGLVYMYSLWFLLETTVRVMPWLIDRAYENSVWVISGSITRDNLTTLDSCEASNSNPFECLRNFFKKRDCHIWVRLWLPAVLKLTGVDLPEGNRLITWGCRALLITVIGHTFQEVPQNVVFNVIGHTF